MLQQTGQILALNPQLSLQRMRRLCGSRSCGNSLISSSTALNIASAVHYPLKNTKKTPIENISLSLPCMTGPKGHKRKESETVWDSREKETWGKVRLEKIKQSQCKSAKIITGFTSPVPPSSDQKEFAAVSVLQKCIVWSIFW